MRLIADLLVTTHLGGSCPCLVPLRHDHPATGVGAVTFAVVLLGAVLSVFPATSGLRAADMPAGHRSGHHRVRTGADRSGPPTAAARSRRSCSRRSSSWSRLAWSAPRTARPGCLVRRRSRDESATPLRCLSHHRVSSPGCGRHRSGTGPDALGREPGAHGRFARAGRARGRLPPNRAAAAGRRGRPYQDVQPGQRRPRRPRKAAAASSAVKTTLERRRPLRPVASSSCESSTHYVNDDGDCVRRPTEPGTGPSGASARCKDGQLSYSRAGAARAPAMAASPSGSPVPPTSSALRSGGRSATARWLSVSGGRAWRRAQRHALVIAGRALLHVAGLGPSPGPAPTGPTSDPSDGRSCAPRHSGATSERLGVHHRLPD